MKIAKKNARTIAIKDNTDKVLWTNTVQGQKGFNEYRWDLVVNKQNSQLPYFVHYERFLITGRYTLVLSDGKTALEQVFIVKNEISPYRR